MSDVLTALGAIGAAWIFYDIGRSRGHSKGYDEGYELARGWRDEMIEKYKAMVAEALRQRDEVRAERPYKAPPNPFAYKDVN